MPYKLPSKIVCRIMCLYFSSDSWSAISFSMASARIFASSESHFLTCGSSGCSPVCSWYCKLMLSIIAGLSSGTGVGRMPQFLSPFAGNSRSVSLAETVLTLVLVRLKKALERLGWSFFLVLGSYSPRYCLRSFIHRSSTSLRSRSYSVKRPFICSPKGVINSS